VEPRTGRRSDGLDVSFSCMALLQLTVLLEAEAFDNNPC
jgi:hypothetical protein